MILHIMDRLKEAGIKEIIINTHHLHEKFRPVLGNGAEFNLKIKYSYEKILLDTGGGLKKVEYFLRGGVFIMHNCDVVTDFDILKMVDYHKSNKNYITLLGSRIHNPKALKVDKMGRVLGFIKGGGGNCAFCGIHIIEPFIFKFIPKNKPISIITVYRKLIENGIPINIFSLRNSFWQEAGNLRSYEDICGRKIITL